MYGPGGGDVRAARCARTDTRLVRLKPDTTSDDEESVRLKPDTASGATDGAIATFTGLVRDHNQGRRVRFLDAKRMPLAVRALSLIVEEAQTRGRPFVWVFTIESDGWTSARPA